MKDSKRLIAMSEEFSEISTIARNIEVENREEKIDGVVYIPQNHVRSYPTNISQNLQPNKIPPQM